MTLTLEEIRQESALVRALRLSAPGGAALPAFGPGAHLRVAIPGLAEPRCYSLVQVQADARAFAQPPAYWLGVRREDAGGGGSRFMHTLQVGQTLTVDGPRNDFPLHEAPAGDPPVLLIAGGIGITPIASMAAALTAAGRRYALHLCGRSRDQLAFLPALQTLAGDALHVHADDDADTAFDLAAVLDAAKPEQHLYVCGPKGMIDAVVAGARERGWPEAHVHFELFVTAAAQAGDTAFEVELRQSGRTLHIPADKTILEVMEAEGCDPLYDCKRGECGVCQANVLEGEPDHRDYYLSEVEKASGKVIQLCISRARSARLVLDL